MLIIPPLMAIATERAHTRGFKARGAAPQQPWLPRTVVVVGVLLFLSCTYSSSLLQASPRLRGQADYEPWPTGRNSHLGRTFIVFVRVVTAEDDSWSKPCALGWGHGRGPCTFTYVDRETPAITEKSDWVISTGTFKVVLEGTLALRANTVS